MGHRLGIVNLRRNPAVIFPLIMAEHIFIPVFAGSKNHKLNILGADFVHDALDQVKALLVRKAGNDADHELLIVPLKSKFFLERPLVLDLFLAEGAGVIVLDNIGVCLRVEFVVVDAVYDSAQVAGTRTHEAV